MGKGILSVEMLAKAAVEDLTTIRAIDDEFAAYLIQSARKISGISPEDAPAASVTKDEPQQDDLPLVDEPGDEAEVESDAGIDQPDQEQE